MLSNTRPMHMCEFYCSSHVSHSHICLLCYIFCALYLDFDAKILEVPSIQDYFETWVLLKQNPVWKAETVTFSSSFMSEKKFLAKPKMELVRKTEGNWMKLFHFQLVNFNLQKHCQLVSSEGRMQTRLKIYQCIRYLHNFWWFFYIMCK